LLARRLHRDFPGGFAVGSLNFSAIALLINADELDDAERAMDVLRVDAEDEQMLGAVGMLGAIPPSILLTAMLGCRGRLRLAQDDPVRAIEDLAGAGERNAAWLLQRVEPPWRPLLAEALVLAGRREEAVAEA